jgi:DNA-binding CsgD family transcriptional regulator
MRSTKKPALPRLIGQDTILTAKAPKVGLLLIDLSLKPIAYDRGALAILQSQSYATIKSESHFFLPREVMEMVGNLKSHSHTSMKVLFRAGNIDYSCTAYLMESQDGFPAQTIVALHIERLSSVTDAVSAVAAKYHLTEREQEALKGISMGLCSKELAERMQISPNTVKVFLRLIMIKMGVSTRGGIVAEILQNQNDAPLGEMDTREADREYEPRAEGVSREPDHYRRGLLAARAKSSGSDV